MHMADALITPTVAGAMYICSAAAAKYSMKKLSLENDPKKIPLMGIMGAFVFAAQMINFTIPVLQDISVGECFCRQYWDLMQVF